MQRDAIFDVDGTLADNSHRQGYVANKPKNWAAYNARISEDTPHHDIIWLAKLMHSAGCRIIICTGREATQFIKTKTWLDEIAGMAGIYERIYCRAEKDYRVDSIIKLELLQQIRADGYDPYMVFDDRQQVVDAWRSVGMRCLQVAPGNF